MVLPKVALPRSSRRRGQTHREGGDALGDTLLVPPNCVAQTRSRLVQLVMKPSLFSRGEGGAAKGGGASEGAGNEGDPSRGRWP